MREELAARSGLSACTLCAYERDRGHPSWRGIARLVLVLGSEILPASTGEPAGRLPLAPARGPGLRCRCCGGVIATGSPRFARNGPAVCLACLPTGPDAPFGVRLKACRLAAGLTQRGLAKRAGLHPQNLRVCPESFHTAFWTLRG
jgi:transcriptional regulator with XRE-family HTH domain